MAEDPTVYHTMNGPSEFHCIGSLKTWDITDRLPEIDVPTFLVSGRYDEATPHIVEQIHQRIPGAQWQLFDSRATCRTSRSRRRSWRRWRAS
jgi:L-proline amide hydrolase